LLLTSSLFGLLTDIEAVAILNGSQFIKVSIKVSFKQCGHDLCD